MTLICSCLLAVLPACFAQCCFSPTVVLCLPFWKELVFGMLAFEGRGKLEHPNKNLSEQEGENQQQIQPTYMYDTPPQDLHLGHISGKRVVTHTTTLSFLSLPHNCRRQEEPAAYSWSAALFYCIVKFFPNLSTFLGCSCCTN